MPPQAVEINFDGLIDPTHNYAGLAHGNLASQQHKQNISHPRQAALQGLAKMKLLMDLGVPQGVLPPQSRPDLATLRRLGFHGTEEAILAAAARDAPTLLAACYSASSMWAANAATVSPSPDTTDGRVHITPANLVNYLHRSIETSATTAVLRAIFHDYAIFAHHDPLPACTLMADEGAANHTRLCAKFDGPGLELFVYGKSGLSHDALGPSPIEMFKVQDLERGRINAMPITPKPEFQALSPAKFPARQTREASMAIARLHRLNPSRVMFIQQNPAAIDAGVFHNDVIAVGHLNVLLYHSAAWCDTPLLIDDIRQRFFRITGTPLITIEVTPKEVPLVDAVASYLFNSQIVSLPQGGMALIAPYECQELDSTKHWLSTLPQRNTPIQSIHFVNMRESMQNGGGPACLRLRVALTPHQLSRVSPGVILTPTLYNQLVAWVHHHYREQLSPADLADPNLLLESRQALTELHKILLL